MTLYGTLQGAQLTLRCFDMTREEASRKELNGRGPRPWVGTNFKREDVNKWKLCPYWLEGVKGWRST